MLRVRTSSALLLCGTLLSCPAAAAERIVSIVPSDGIAMLVKRVSAPAGTTISGVTFGNNDPRTVFPEVLLLQDVTDAVGAGSIRARATDVTGGDVGGVTVTWAEPITSDGRDYFVAVRFPNGPGRQGIGNGPGLAAVDVSDPAGSFLAIGANGDMNPVKVDLVMTLLTAGAGKAGPTSDGPALVPTFLGGGTPNPTTSSMRVEFGLERALPARLAIYDVVGRQVRLLHDGSLDVGTHSRTWDGRDDGGVPVAAGVYIARLHAGEKVLTQKIVIAK
jgi:flagellar hook capping protein FlgD